MAGLNPICTLILLAAFMAFAARRVPRYLHFLQQDDYDSSRFTAWLLETRAYDRRLSIALLVIEVLLLVSGLYFEWPLRLLVAAIFAYFAWREADPRKEAKKKLVMTERATRIYIVCLILAFLLAGLIALYGGLFLWIVAVQLLPFLLVEANRFLAPAEKRIQQRFWDEAHAKLLQINPTVVGITGSFGKTSLKHILGHTLELNARTLYTPGSVNTLMGIARIIRENLRPDCRFFLVEMGAYGVNSIQRLCQLTPPKFGIITAIGDAHYERYKTLDAVARAKFELAEAVCSHADGKMAVHESVLAQPYAAEFVKQHVAQFVIYGAGNNAQVKITRAEQTQTGLEVDIAWQGTTYNLTAPLYGSHHADNMAGAFAVAMLLGIAPDRFIAALRTTPQITHRLEVKPQADGIIIDDAFNSNQQGFVAAMELVSFLSGGAKRRILITPGVAELGERNDSVHGELGEKAAKLIDVALIVRSDRIPSFAAGYRRAGGKEIHEFASLTEARAWLNANKKSGDIVLYENDLPDLLERKLRL